MKSIAFRLLGSPLLFGGILLMVVMTVWYSNDFYHETYESVDRWRAPIDEYDSPEELKALYESYKEEKAEFEAAHPDTDEMVWDDEYEYRLITERVQNLEYLMSHYYAYSEIRDGNWMQSCERSSWVYSANIFDKVWPFVIGIFIVWVYLIVISGKVNGAFIFETIMNGRKRIFSEQFVFGGILVTILSLLQFVLIAILRTQFMNTTTYLLYNTNGHITVISERLEFVGLCVYILAKTLLIYTVFFCIAQIISSAIGYCIASVALCALVNYLNNHVANHALNAWNSALVYITSKDYSLSFMLLIKLLGTGILAVLFFTAWRIVKTRNIRTQYEG